MGADPVGGAVFRLATPACPDAVWEALTCAVTTPRWLYGLALMSTWEPGAAVTGALDGPGAAGTGALDGPGAGARPAGPGAAAAARVTGTVLFAEPPARLSYAFEDPGGAVTYVSWHLRPTPAGTVLRLRVEEPGATEDEIEDAWLPVVTALGGVLAARTETTA